MIIENLPSLQIHRLTKAQYQDLVDAGKADDKALYLIPDNGNGSGDIDIDISQEIGTNPSPEEIPSSKAVADYVEAKIPKFTTDSDLNDPDADLGNTIATAQMMKTYVEETVPTVVDDLTATSYSRNQKVPSVTATINYVNDQITSVQPNIVETIDTTNLGGKIPSDAATVNYVNSEIAALIGDDSRYPKALDTINEISAAIKDNVETLDILNEAIASKVNQSDFDKFKTDSNQSIANLNSSIALKTNQTDFEAFQTEHAQIVTNLEQGIEGRVSQSVYDTDLASIRTNFETVNTTLNEKANASDLNNYVEELNATIETLAPKADLDTKVDKDTYTTDLAQTNAALEEATNLINTKASQENLDNVELALEAKANKDETSAAITALDDRIDTTNETLKTKVNSSDIISDAILGGSNKIPTAGLVYSFVKGEIAIPEAVQLQIWSQEDGWYHVTNTLQVSNDKFIELNDESVLLKQGQHFICWQPNGDTITGWSDALSCEYTIRSTSEEIVAGSTALPTAQAVIDYVDAALVDYTPTTPDWNAAEDEPGYIKNKPFETTSSGSGTPDLVLDESTIIGREENVNDGRMIATGMFESDFMVVHGQTYTLIYTLYDGTQIKNKVTAMYGYELNPDPDYGQKDAIHLSDTTNDLAVISGGGMVVYQHVDLYSKIEIYTGEPGGTTKIQHQYIETITKVEDATAQANEIPTVSAVQELIQQAIEESLYIDEEEYV